MIVKGYKIEPGANLIRADLSGADLCLANLSGADLCLANLSGANLRWANLIDTNLSEADLRQTYLIDADLSGTNLEGANLMWAYLINVDLSGAKLKGANLMWAYLSGANLTNTILDPVAIPNGDVEGFETYTSRSGEVWCAGYRTDNSLYIGERVYCPGLWYHAPYFSVCPVTDCHPGIFVLPSRTLVEKWDNNIVKCWFRAIDCHHVGNKWRVTDLFVDSLCEEEETL